ncbi:MAG: conjugal transfer protein TraX [Lachnospiraceae bacterium]|nr:conjugal transfer protein TraX [Lachnospiraceae bacterium]MDD7026644.1 TraX family protein [Lachnospiraceae bacterium]MDY5700964.1 TraX family protein [Lachnospiraceae bacterium]
MKENRPGLSGSTLKWIALITMLIDHTGAVVVQRMVGLSQFDTEFWYGIYWPLRSIGRVAFPIYCFLLVEGFLHTKNVKKYLGRLLIFAVISEIPFNLALTGSWQSTQYQNVYWELALGLTAIWLIRVMEEKPVHYVVQVIWKLLVLTTGMILGKKLNLDYGFYGIFSIVVLYLTRKNKAMQVVAGGLSFAWENPAPVAFIPIAFYNGKRGGGLKYLFYIFYPAHLLILYIIARAIGCPY